MFRPSNQPRAKSPYQPKLLNTLIDSSDQDNFSIDSDKQAHDDFVQLQNRQDRSIPTKNQYGNVFSNEDKLSVKSVYSSLSQQTLKVRPFVDMNQTKNVKQSNPPSSNQSHLSRPQTLNLTRFTQSKQPKQTQENNLSSLSQKSKSSHSPNMVIKYDTLKLSEYDSKEVRNQENKYQQNLKEIKRQDKIYQHDIKEIKKQEQLYQQNLREFRQKFNSSKPQQAQHKNNQIPIRHQRQQLDDYMDSLQAMKHSNLNRRHFSRKNLKNQVSTPSSRIKFLQQQREPNSSQKQQHQIDLLENGSLQIEKLRQELKRSKDVIKTLGLKNADLQKTLEMKSTKLLQLQSEQSIELIEAKQVKDKQQAKKKVYSQINCYMKVRVKQFMEEISNVKMSPLLQQSLETFLAQILQVNQVTVSKKVAHLQSQQQKQQQFQYPHQQFQYLNQQFREGLKQQFRQLKSQFREPLKQVTRNTTPNRQSKSIFNTRTEVDQKPQSKKQPINFSQEGNRLQKSNVTSHKTIVTNRSNAFINGTIGNNRQNAFIDNIIGANRQKAFINSKGNHPESSQIQGYSVKLDLSYNKQNITPNKRPSGDKQLKQLQKSLQKLKAMQKELSTPLPKNSFTTNKSHFISNNNNDEYRTEYSIVNRSQLSGLGKEDNNNSGVMNLTANNLDRSKSRRKKIFAQSIQK